MWHKTNQEQIRNYDILVSTCREVAIPEVHVHIGPVAITCVLDTFQRWVVLKTKRQSSANNFTWQTLCGVWMKCPHTTWQTLRVVWYVLTLHDKHCEKCDNVPTVHDTHCEKCDNVPTVHDTHCEKCDMSPHYMTHIVWSVIMSPRYMTHIVWSVICPHATWHTLWEVW